MFLVITLNKEGILSSVEFTTIERASAFASELSKLAKDKFPYIVVKEK